MGDVSSSVVPKFALLSSPRDGGTITARYFMPLNCHPTMAVTGAQCLASCVLTPRTVAEGLGTLPDGIPALVKIEHPSGVIDVTVDYEARPQGFVLKSAGILRTARLLARGEVLVPI
nr:PrpF domain-containing protein [Rhizobium rhizophilum]